MAQIWTNDENAGAHMLPRSTRKPVGDTAVQESAKKNVLGKLDNVLYNKSSITPFKGAASNTIWSQSCAPKLSLFKETLQKQHRMQNNKTAPHLVEEQLKAPQSHATSNAYAKSEDSSNIYDLFDYMDFPTEKCLGNCHKSISDNWLDPLNYELISQILTNSVDTEEQPLPYELPVHVDFDKDEFEMEPLEYFNQDCCDVSDRLNAMLPLPILYADDLDLF